MNGFFRTNVTLIIFQTVFLSAQAQFAGRITDIHGNEISLNPGPSLPPQKSSEAGNPWIPVGPFGGDVIDLAIDPQNPGVLFAAAGTPFMSNDGGENWDILSSLSSQSSGSVNAFAVTADGTVFASGRYTFGKIFRSTDGGSTWHTRNLPVNSNGLCLEVDPNDSSTIYEGLASNISLPLNKVIVRSEDAGETWTAMDMTSVLPLNWSVVDIGIDPDNGQTIFAVGNTGFSEARIVASFDGGNTWQNRTGNLPAGVPYNGVAVAGQKVFVAGGQMFGSQYMGVYMSADWGATWTNISAGFPNKVSNDIIIDSTDIDRMYVATEGDGIYYTADGGTTWQYDATGAGENGAAQCLSITPGDPGLIYAGFLSLAVCRSGDAGLTWEYANTGISALQVTDIEINPLDPGMILMGFEAENSGGCYISGDGGETWTLAEELPGTRYSQVKFGSGGNMYAWSNGPTTVAQEGLYKSTDGGATWSNTGPDLGSVFETQVFALAASSSDPGLIFIGGNNFGVNGWASVIYRTTDGGQQWTKTYTGPEENFYSIRFLFIDPNSDDQVVYAGYKSEVQGGFLKSIDGGITWTETGATIPVTYKWGGAIVCSPDNSLKLLAGCGGYGNPGTICISPDGGESWSATSLNLGNYSKISDILFHPAASDVAYLASTMTGVQISTNGGATWVAANEGLGSTNVTGFSNPYQAGGIWQCYASTYSNSNYRTELFDPASNIREHFRGSALHIFPNPGDGTFHVNVTGGDRIMKTGLFSVTGEPVQIVTGETATREGIRIRTGAPSGLYILRVFCSGAVLTDRLIIR